MNKAIVKNILGEFYVMLKPEGKFQDLRYKYLRSDGTLHEWMSTKDNNMTGGTYYSTREEAQVLADKFNFYKKWFEMSAKEKGSLLLAEHEGKTIEIRDDFGHWIPKTESWKEFKFYRVKPEVEVKHVYVHLGPESDIRFFDQKVSFATHKLTFYFDDAKTGLTKVDMEEL